MGPSKTGVTTLKRVREEELSCVDDLLVVPITKGFDFWQVYDALVDSKSEFVRNRSILINAFKRNELFGIKVPKKSNSSRILSSVILENTNLLPTLCVIDGMDENMCSIVWVHPKIRRMGIGSLYVKHFRWDAVDNVLKESIEFWKKNNVEILNILNY